MDHDTFQVTTARRDWHELNFNAAKNLLGTTMTLEVQALEVILVAVAVTTVTKMLPIATTTETSKEEASSFIGNSCLDQQRSFGLMDFLKGFPFRR
jgi:hypothetical protein